MSTKAVANDQPIHIGFLVVPHYSAIALWTALEPLRMANQLTGRSLYTWSVITPDDSPVPASNGLAVATDTTMAEAGEPDLLFVCGGIRIKEACATSVLRWLRQLAARKVKLGAVCTGTYVLARAGVLEGYRCTIHWENISSIYEELAFPHTIFTTDLFVVDRDRYTCSGGIAPLDMMLNLIAEQYGQTLAEEISDEFIHERIRNVSDSQRIPLRVHLGASQPKLIDTVRMMEANIEDPIPVDTLAQVVDLSRRQLERLFRKYLRTTPAHYYLGLRLSRARHLLLQTDISVVAIALACGFSSTSHFSKCYHNLFGHPPSWERRRYSMEKSPAAIRKPDSPNSDSNKAQPSTDAVMPQTPPGP